MKRVLITLAIALLANACYSQVTVTRDKKGNYIAAKSAPKAADTTGKRTGKTYTDRKGQVYPVYLSNTGRPFVVRISKTGNVYKQYLKLVN